MELKHILVCLLVLITVTLIHCKPSAKIQKERQETEKPKLRFNIDGKLKIVNFADLHYGEFPGTPLGHSQDDNSTRVMRYILQYENPDLVVFTGDFITGDAILSNGTGFIETILTPLITGNYRWASTYGNHDNGITVTREAIFATESKYVDLCYTQHDIDGLEGLTNYYLPIYAANASDLPNEKPILILWFFDSRGGFDPDGIKPSNVDVSVVNWFNKANDNITALWGKLPALAFFHIPTLDYVDVQADIPNRPDCVGLVDEAVVPQDRDTLFMDALVNSGTVMTTFVGHDHGNAWCCAYKTLEICYNRHTGYGGYGDWDRGARVIELDSNDLRNNRRNYIRMENGEIIDEYLQTN